MIHVNRFLVATPSGSQRTVKAIVSIASYEGKPFSSSDGGGAGGTLSLLAVPERRGAEVKSGGGLLPLWTEWLEGPGIGETDADSCGIAEIAGVGGGVKGRGYGNERGNCAP